MKQMLSIALALSTLVNSAPAFAQDARIELRECLRRGDAVSVELKNGRRLAGAVGDTQSDGFWIEHPPAEPSFVRFRSVRAVLDPDTGAVIGLAAHDRDGLSKGQATALGIGVVVGALVLATRGCFPLCFFVPRT